MTKISRRRLLFAPLIAVAAPSLPTTGPQRPNMARIEARIRQLNQMQQTWPDRAQETPEPLTLEQLTARTDVLAIVDKIHTMTLAELAEWIFYCVWMIGGQTFPPAKGEL